MTVLNLQTIEKRRESDDGSLDVFEVFPTIQGEGPLAGEPAVFVRLAGCNLQCPGCDTDYTSKRRTVGVEDLVAEVQSLTTWYTHHWWDRWSPTLPPRPLVVLTGGEPFRQRCGPFVGRMLRTHRVQVETNGTLYDDSMHGWWQTTSVVCSPKGGRIATGLESVISAYKYVLRADEVDPADGLPVSVLGGSRPARPHAWYPRVVYVQPMDEQDPLRNDANTRAVVESCRRFGYRLCLQLHKLIGLP